MSKKTNKNLEGKKSYELSFLLKDPASERSVIDLLLKYKGSVVKQSPINSMKLAYPIKKHTSAYFGYINFEADPIDVKEFSDSMRLNGEVIRFLIVTAPVVKKSEEKEESKRVKPELTNSKTLTNEALEEQLEEILK